jgi:hypothetical protein
MRYESFERGSDHAWASEFLSEVSQCRLLHRILLHAGKEPKNLLGSVQVVRAEK